MITKDNLGSYLFLAVLISGLAACRGASPAGVPSQQISAPVTTTSPMAPEPKPTGLIGQVLSYSDISGQPDEPLPDQMVLAFPSEMAGEILGSGPMSLTDDELRFMKANLSGANPAIAVTLSDAAGEYTLHLDPGAYILCLADSDKIPPDFPARTRGCGRVVVARGELKRVDISSGFGEILLIAK
jgi:hypothetical protein